ncbi:response regulator [Thermodesulfovibrio yellowstonii]|jgi:two-component system chemotaxis response regulator CheY|uniref:Response regulator n=1 Tax=Thermodesulfovibrio yellowstonii TaxID=28262 RepID=A0A9W6GD35_9BACT|nr:response regulator [Thermodesulfovibrio islandicus]GLI52988.1 response regulator [Thermodesulfovibrio islandicus]
MKKVLVVDDASTVRMYHKKILGDAGFNVDEAVNGLEALEKAYINNYDLYIVDINMPKLDGYSFVRKLRSSKNLNQAPVIMVTTEAEEKDKNLAYQAGANFYMVKPVKPEELVMYAKIFTGVTS